MATLSNLIVNTQRAYGAWNDEINAQHQALEVQNACNLRALVSLNFLQNPNNLDVDLIQLVRVDLAAASPLWIV